MTDLEIIKESLEKIVDCEFQHGKPIKEIDCVLTFTTRLAKRVEELEGEIAKEESDKIDLIALLETITNAYPDIERWKAYKQTMNGMEAKWTK